MTHRILVLALAVIGAAILASPALASRAPHRYSPKPGQHCRNGYKRVKHRSRVFCVKRKKVAAKTQVEKVKLHAHLDPTFTRDPLDPFKVTYAYSASATQEVEGRASISSESAAPLPSGVLALYSDGKLECAVNVGSGIEGSECPVSYEALGDHRVTTIYSSGEQSATETEVENIGPLGTTTSLSVSYSPLAIAQSSFGCGDNSACEVEAGQHENGGFKVGTLSVHATTSLPGAIPVSACGGSEISCIPITLNGSGNASFSVKVIANYTALEEKSVALGEAVAIDAEAPNAVTLLGLPQFAQVPLAEAETGIFYFRVASPSRTGYATSAATAPIQLAPTVTSQVERIPLSAS